MEPKHLIHDYPPFADVHDDLILDNDQSYVLEPPMADARRCPWYVDFLVPISVECITFISWVIFPKLPNYLSIS